MTLLLHHVCLIQVTTAPGFHLFPFRTEKLSPVTPMVLRNSGRVGSRRFREAPVFRKECGALLFMERLDFVRHIDRIKTLRIKSL